MEAAPSPAKTVIVSPFFTSELEGVVSVVAAVSSLDLLVFGVDFFSVFDDDTP